MRNEIGIECNTYYGYLPATGTSDLRTAQSATYVGSVFAVQPLTRYSNMTERVAYSSEEVAIVCGIGRTLVYGHLKQGKLKKIKVGRRTLITAEEVQR